MVFSPVANFGNHPVLTSFDVTLFIVSAFFLDMCINRLGLCLIWAIYIGKIADYIFVTNFFTNST